MLIRFFSFLKRNSLLIIFFLKTQQLIYLVGDGRILDVEGGAGSNDRVPRDFTWN